MMSYVCRQCRARLGLRLTARPPRPLPQWQSRAAFVSLRGTQPEQPPSAEEAPSQPVSATPPAPPAQHAIPSAAASHRHTPTDASPSPSDQTLLLRSLAHCCRRGELDNAWKAFVQAFPSADCPLLTHPTAAELDLLSNGRIIKSLSSLVLDAFVKGAATPVTPSEMLFRFERLGLHRLIGSERVSGLGRQDVHDGENPSARVHANTFPLNSIWSSALVVLQRTALWAPSHSGQQQPRVDGQVLHKEVAQAERERIILEWLSVWRLLLQCKGRAQAPLDAVDPDWTSVPSAAQLADSMRRSGSRRHIQGRLSHYLPRLHIDTMFAADATILFAFLTSPSMGAHELSESLQTEGAPFKRLMTYILAGANIKNVTDTLTKRPRQFPDDIRETCLHTIRSAPSDAMALIGGKALEDKPLSVEEQARNRDEFLLKRIQRAFVEKAHKNSLEHLWKETLAIYSGQDGSPRIPSVVYNAFLTGYMALFAADRSVEVWNHMIAHGVDPDVKTWTAMLSGCEKARDLDGLNAVWHKMIQSGTQPDEYAWTTRVHALISLRQINAGLAAMDEMARLWIASEQATKPTKTATSKQDQAKTAAVPRPSITVINGAASALVGIPHAALTFNRKVENITKILKWAGNFSIDADSRTYNILIKLYTSGGDYSTTFGLLRQMEANGIEADVATYSMLILASFDKHQFRELPSDELIAKIHSLLNEIEAAGLKLNSYIYSSIMDRLIKQRTDFVAARAVIDHMMSRQLVVGPHIYTTLITHYFDSDSPNIEAVDSLWHQIISTPGTPTDKILFDRLIEGYAKHAEIGKMMAVLTRMSAHGKLPGWRALTAVVQALANAGDVERARSVVYDVKNGVGVANGGIMGGMHGQRDFFALVEHLRLFGEEGQSSSVWQPEGRASEPQQETEQRRQDWREDNGSIEGVPL